ncbi:MAG TPA: hypothetical protein VIL85_05600 [Thermomicrobiales bacterium]
MKDRFVRLFRAPRASPGTPLSLSVREAWLAHERYVGRQVVLMGVVRAFEAGTPDQYFTLDDGPNRVGLRGDVATLREQIDRPIRATGLLVFKPGDGIFLVADTVLPAV